MGEAKPPVVPTTSTDNASRFAHGETAGRAIFHILLGLVFFAGVCGAYVIWAKRSHAIKAEVSDTAPLVLRGDTRSLREAEKVYLGILERDADNAYALSGLAEIYALLWVDHGIVEMRPKAETYLAQVVAEDVEKAERFSAEALVALGQGKLTHAEALLQRVMGRGAVSEKLYFVMGLVQRAQGKLQLGRENLVRAQDLASGASHFARAVGDAYDDDGDVRNAAYLWSLATNSNGDDLIAAARHFVGQMRQGKHLEKLQLDLQRLVEKGEAALPPLDRAALAEAQTVFAMHHGRFEEALKHLDGLSSTVMQPRFLDLRAEVLEALGRRDEALTLRRQAYDTSAQAKRYLYALVQSESQLGQHTEALARLDGKAEGLDQEADYWRLRGDVLRQQGETEAALKDYGKALALHSRHPESLLSMGRLAWKSGDHKAAAGWFEKAVDARNAYPEVYESVGFMWSELGAVRDADRQFQMAEQLYRTGGASVPEMQRFYNEVIGHYRKTRGGRRYQRGWQKRQEEFLRATRPASQDNAG